MGQGFGIHADLVVAQGVAGADTAGDGADGRNVPRRAKQVPQAPPAAGGALDHAHGAGPHVGPDGLSPMAVDGGTQALGDFVNCLVPGDALEAALAFLACAAQG